MNYLGHLLLSGNDEYLIVGNFITDQLGHKSLSNVPVEYSTGISLHRFIDRSTDSSAYFKKSLKLLYPTYSKYASVALDVLLDYFIAKNWASISQESFDQFKERVYEVLSDHLPLISNSYERNNKKMISADWLTQYSHWDGIKDVYRRLDMRTTFPSSFENNTEFLMLHEGELESGFDDFIDSIQGDCSEFILQSLT